jgi:hypothetical protein
MKKEWVSEIMKGEKDKCLLKSKEWISCDKMWRK